MADGRLLNSLSTLLKRLDRGHVNDVLTDALNLTNHIYPPPPERSRVLGEIGSSASLNPRMGYVAG
jgi:hypothetical protein